MGLLDDIKNAIFSFFDALGNFLINILITIKDKLLDFISWLANGLWSLFLSVFNKVKDAINSLFVKPLTDFTNRVLNRFYQKIDGMIMILVGVPLTWKSIENFINDPSKKRFIFIPLALAFSYFLSKIVGQVIRTFMSKWITQGVSLPSMPSASVSQMLSTRQVDSLTNDTFNYSIRPAWYIIDTLIGDKILVSRKSASETADTLASDSFSSSITSRKIYPIEQLDTLLTDVVSTSERKPITLLDNLNMNDKIDYKINHIISFADSIGLTDLLSYSIAYRPTDNMLADTISVKTSQIPSMPTIDNTSL